MPERMEIEYGGGIIPGPFLREGLVAAVSCRQDGNMSLNYGGVEDSLKSRINFLDRLGIDHRSLVCAKQEHGSRVFLAEDDHAGRGALEYSSAIPETDALITDCRRLPLAVFTADCLSVFLSDRDHPAIGLVHAGWRGLKEGIISKTVAAMREEFGTESASLCALFGPAIRECCYEVGEEFRDYFPESVSRSSGSLYLDLTKEARAQLSGCGLKSENILDTRICTSCSGQQMFSFRKEKDGCGRMMSVLMLK